MASEEKPTQDPENPEKLSERRSFFRTTGKLAMAGGLVAGYGTCGAMAVRYLYPAQDRPQRWMYVIESAKLVEGQSILYRAPSGESISVTRRSPGDEEGAFIALSSTCPHLGCQVRWEAQNSRFFCPCHNGVFSPEGVAQSGPPAESKRDLPRFPLKVEGGLLFIKVPIDSLNEQAEGEIVEPCGPPGPGHDPCLYKSVKKA